MKFDFFKNKPEKRENENENQNQNENKMESKTENEVESESHAEVKTGNEETAGKTEIYNLIILDKSGSMSSISHAAISGFNETIAAIRQAQEKFQDTQEHYVSLMIFCNCEKKMLYDKVPVAEVQPLTSDTYIPCCCTPLYDAMGISLTTLRKDITDKENATAAVTIITDGLENASREYNLAAIKALVEELTEKEGWQFSYIGTNQDVHKVSADLSIHAAMSFDYDEEGMKKAWKTERMAKERMFSCISMESAVSNLISPSERKKHWAEMNARRSYYANKDMMKDRVTPEMVTDLNPNEVFVFGSNIDGLHDGGAAAYAVQHFGAVVGQAEGLQGSSYAIPTVGVSRVEMNLAVRRFIDFASQNPDKKFLVTKIGCGHAGYSQTDMALAFAGAFDVPNISLPKEFWECYL